MEGAFRSPAARGFRGRELRSQRAPAPRAAMLQPP